MYSMHLCMSVLLEEESTNIVLDSLSSSCCCYCCFGDEVSYLYNGATIMMKKERRKCRCI